MTHTVKNILLFGAAVLALSACDSASKTKATDGKDAATSAAVTGENARLDGWFEETFMENARMRPEFLANLGLKERMSEWNDPSRAFTLEQLDKARQDLAEMKANFDVTKLDASHQLSYRLFERNVQNQIEGDQWYYHSYPFNQMFGAQSSVPTFMMNKHKIDTIDDARAYIDRLNGIQAYMDTIVERAEISSEKGVQPPKFVFAHVIRDAENIIKGAPFEDTDTLNVLLADFETKVKKLDLPKETQSELYEGAITALLTSVRPAYQNIITTMKAHQAKATTDDGVWKLPEGDDYYAYRLEMITTTDMSASEIHDLGLTEVDRIHAEMREIMKKVDFDGSLQEFFKFLQDDPQFTYPDTDAGRQAYIDQADVYVAGMKKRLPEMFSQIPKADVEVRAVEAFREKSAGKAFYNRPSLDGKRPGIYYANLYTIADMPKYQLEALSYHEAVPGHHMQITLAQEMDGIPKFRKFMGVTAYSEGWGLYSEYLPKEMGFYEDPYSDFGRLAMELWRAGRLVVDTGLHDKKWTREKAIQYLVDNTPNPENDCRRAIERYIVLPAQATAYKIGMNKIIDLREKAKSELGDKFDNKAFHDAVLGAGPVPLGIMEERVDAMIKTKA